MQILVTNDDGIHADGIKQLAKELERDEDNEVVVVAPDREQSATGHAITLHKPLRVKEMNFADIQAKTLAINGTPADCVKLGVEAILDQTPDLVISGINQGPNLGHDVLYSGTVSAAFEGLLLGIPAIAVSLATYEDWNFTYAAKFIRGLVQDLDQESFKSDVLLNINIPPLEKEELNGVKVTKLGNRSYTNVFDQRIDPRGESYYWLAGEIVEESNDEETDVTSINQDKVSITPIKLDLTDFESMAVLDKKELKLF